MFLRQGLMCPDFPGTWYVAKDPPTSTFQVLGHALPCPVYVELRVRVSNPGLCASLGKHSANGAVAPTWSGWNICLSLFQNKCHAECCSLLHAMGRQVSAISPHLPTLFFQRRFLVVQCLKNNILIWSQTWQLT